MNCDWSGSHTLPPPPRPRHRLPAPGLQRADLKPNSLLWCLSSPPISSCPTFQTYLKVPLPQMVSSPSLASNGVSFPSPGASPRTSLATPSPYSYGAGHPPLPGLRQKLHSPSTLSSHSPVFFLNPRQGSSLAGKPSQGLPTSFWKRTHQSLAWCWTSMAHLLLWSPSLYSSPPNTLSLIHSNAPPALPPHPPQGWGVGKSLLASQPPPALPSYTQVNPKGEPFPALPSPSTGSLVGSYVTRNFLGSPHSWILEAKMLAPGPLPRV